MSGEVVSMRRPLQQLTSTPLAGTGRRFRHRHPHRGRPAVAPPQRRREQARLRRSSRGLYVRLQRGRLRYLHKPRVRGLELSAPDAVVCVFHVCIALTICRS